MTKPLPFHDDRTVDALTVAEIRERLATLPDDAILTWWEYDMEWDLTYHYAITAIGENGEITGQMFTLEHESENVETPDAHG